MVSKQIVLKYSSDDLSLFNDVPNNLIMATKLVNKVLPSDRGE